MEKMGLRVGGWDFNAKHYLFVEVGGAVAVVVVVVFCCPIGAGVSNDWCINQVK